MDRVDGNKDAANSCQSSPPDLVVTSTISTSIESPHHTAHTAPPIHQSAQSMMFPPPPFYYLPREPLTGGYIVPFYIPVPTHSWGQLQQGFDPGLLLQHYPTAFIPVIYPQLPDNPAASENQQYCDQSPPLLQTAPSPESDPHDTGDN